jgi:hypothetical protein
MTCFVRRDREDGVANPLAAAQFVVSSVFYCPPAAGGGGFLT